jgi:hypothetical protein
MRERKTAALSLMAEFASRGARWTPQLGDSILMRTESAYHHRPSPKMHCRRRGGCPYPEEKRQSADRGAVIGC